MEAEFMRIMKCNSEGYKDPTTYEALSNIRKTTKKAYRPLVYICSPFASDIDGNMHKAKRYCRFAVRNGAIPFAHHLIFPQFLDYEKPSEHAIGVFMSMVFLGKCEQLWIFGANISADMLAEIKKAKKKNMQIRYFTEEMKEIK